MQVSLPNNWNPREYQQPAWSALSALSDIRSKLIRAVLVWHRRAGKDDVMLHHNACSTQERIGNYWYMLPEYNQCRKAIWDAINPHTGKKRIDEAFPEAMRAKKLEQEMKIVFKNGSSWQLMGSDNYDALVGSPPVGLTFSEYGLSNPNSWGYLSPILEENNGWAIFNSTPRGKNHFYRMYNYALTDNEWFAQLLTVDDTDVFDPERLQKRLAELQAEHGEDYGKALWLQEYYCSFEAAIPGAIWGDSLTRLSNDGRVTDVPHDPRYPVFTAWDLGRSDMAVAWFFQVKEDRINLIDYWADNFKDIDYMCDMLKDKAVDKNYRFDTHWLPHDAKPTRLGMGGKSMIQQFTDFAHDIKLTDGTNIGSFSLCPNWSREDGIQAARKTFNYCYFDKVRCQIGFDHLKSYHRLYDNEKKTFSITPAHDEHSHPADSFRYLSLVWEFSRDQQVVLSDFGQMMAGSITGMSFKDMKKQHFAKKRRERSNQW